MTNDFIDMARAGARSEHLTSLLFSFMINRVMELNQIVSKMCYEVLAAVDMNAIRKARGFSQSESASRSVFENAFLSSTGLASVMATLSPAEVATLHLLKEQTAPVTVKFFARLYGSGSERLYERGTYSQRYKSTFDAIKKQLVRKGVLVMFEQTGLPGTQMERWRFLLPPAFARFLPPLVAKPHRSDAPGAVRDLLWVEKAREGLGGPPVAAATARFPYQVSLEQGTLRLGGKPFTAGAVEEWQQDTWNNETTWETNAHGDEDDDLDFDSSLLPVDAVLAILGSLEPGQWISPGKMAEPLKIYTFGIVKLSPDKLCQAGWKWGRLARLSENGETHYRLAGPASNSAPEPFEGWLEPQPGGSEALRVDLDKAPLPEFEMLNSLASLSFEQGHLLVRPDLVKLGRSTPEQRQSALAAWLRDNWPSFQQALTQVEQRWGRVIIHQGLQVARVRDLSLRVQIERELKDQVVVLSTEFIAFPPALRPDVERVLRKSGFVVKEVKA